MEGGCGPAWCVAIKNVSVLRYRSTTGRFCRYTAAVSLTGINRMVVLYTCMATYPTTSDRNALHSIHRKYYTAVNSHET